MITMVSNCRLNRKYKSFPAYLTFYVHNYSHCRPDGGGGDGKKQFDMEPDGKMFYNEVHTEEVEGYNRLPDGKMFYDVVHTEEVEDQMTARVEKAVRARENMATKQT